MENNNSSSTNELFKKKDAFSMEAGSDNDLNRNNTIDSVVDLPPYESKNEHVGGYAVNKISEVFGNILNNH
jgi:hypothetical protein